MLALPEAEIPLPLSYRVGLVGVTLALLLLVVGYIAFVGLLAWLSIAWLLRALPTALHGGVVGLLLALVPAAAGLTTVVMIVAPIVRGWRSRNSAVVLEREDEPLLFDFIEKLCDVLGAPMPRRVEVDLEVNASAGLRRGLLSLFGPDDVTLRLGLPLAATLRTREFGSVIAHELGHFTQSSGMRLHYLAGSVLSQLASVLTGEDPIEQKMRSLRAGGSGSMPKFLVRIALLLAETGRGLIWLLWMTGLLASAWLARRKEFDADAFGAHVAGSERFEATSRVISLAGVAAMRSRDAVASGWENSGWLPDDFVALAVTDAVDMPKHVAAKVNQMTTTQKTRWTDTHPSHSERAAFQKELKTPGSPVAGPPARQLFRDFDALCRRATKAWYDDIFDSRLDPRSITPTARVVEERRTRERAEETAGCFFGIYVPVGRNFLPLENVDRPLNRARDALGDLTELRKTMLEQTAAGARAASEHNNVTKALLHFRTHAFICSQPGPNHDRGLAAYLGQLVGRIRSEGQRTADALAPFEEAARERLTLVLRLLRTPEVAQRIGEARVRPLLTRVDELLGPARKLEEAFPLIEEAFIHRNYAAMVKWQSQNGDRRSQRAFEPFLEPAVARYRHTIKRMTHALGSTPYPFETVNPDETIVTWLIKTDADLEKLEDIDSGSDALFKALSLRFRLLAGLTEIAEKVEAMAGMKRLVPAPLVIEEGDEQEQARKNSARPTNIRPARVLVGAAILVLTMGLLSLDLGAVSRSIALKLPDPPAKAIPTVGGPTHSPSSQPPSSTATPMGPGQPMSPGLSAADRRDFVMHLHRVYASLCKFAQQNPGGLFPRNLDEAVSLGLLDANDAASGVDPQQKLVYMGNGLSIKAPGDLLLFVDPVPIISAHGHQDYVGLRVNGTLVVMSAQTLNNETVKRNAYSSGH